MEHLARGELVLPEPSARFHRGQLGVPVITATSGRRGKPRPSDGEPAPAVRHRPGRDQLLPVRVDWAKEGDLHVEGGKVGAALGRRLDSGGRRHPSSTMAPPKTAPYSRLSHPLAGMANTTRPVSTQAGGCPSIGARGSSPRRVAWRISSPNIPPSAREGWKTRTRPHTASAAEVGTVSELREGGRVDRTPAGAEMRARELTT